MSVFASKFNPLSGTMEWIQMDDAFDYSQQIARSAYADMLHDTDRVSTQLIVVKCSTYTSSWIRFKEPKVL